MLNLNKITALQCAYKLALVSLLCLIGFHLSVLKHDFDKYYKVISVKYPLVLKAMFVL